MWLLTTRNRPEMCQTVLDAIERLQGGSEGVLWMDGCDYPNIRLPYGWSKVTCPEHRNIGRIMDDFFHEHLDLPWYGWMSDDCVPLSEHFDKHLIKAAGDYALAYGDDGWLRGQRDDGSGFPNMTSLAVWGGTAVRAVGFWSPPGMIQMCIDEAWARILHPLGLMHFVESVKVDHRHFANGKRERDSTDTRTFNGVKFPAHDREICEALDYQRARKAIVAARHCQTG